MLIYLSHIIGFLVLAIASVFDLRDGEVPDIVFLIGIVFGLILHRFYGLLQGSFEPFIWTLGIGLVFFAYGWLAYLKGMWGGADALALAVLGFTAPFGLDSLSHGHVLDLVFNLMVAILLYSILFVFWKTLKSENFYRDLINHIKEKTIRIGIEISTVLLFSAFIAFIGLNAVFYLITLLSMVILYHFLLVAEESVFTKTVKVENLTGGEVLAKEYSDQKIRGVSKNEVESLDIDKVEVKDGVKLVPVFPIALILTDLNLLGWSTLTYLVG